jgi:hypothetical protein
MKQNTAGNQLSMGLRQKASECLVTEDGKEILHTFMVLVCG